MARKVYRCERYPNLQFGKVGKTSVLQFKFGLLDTRDEEIQQFIEGLKRFGSDIFDVTPPTEDSPEPKRVIKPKSNPKVGARNTGNLGVARRGAEE